MVCCCEHVSHYPSFVEHMKQAPWDAIKQLAIRIFGAIKHAFNVVFRRKVEQISPLDATIKSIELLLAEMQQSPTEEQIAALEKLLNEFADIAVNKSCTKNILKLLEKIPLSYFDDILKAKGQSIHTTIMKIAANIEMAGALPKQSNWFVRTFRYVFNFIPIILNTFLTAFNLFDIGKDPQTFWDISAALDIIYKFVMIPAAIIVILKLVVPGAGLLLYLGAVGGVFLFLALLAIYAKWWKPCPSNLSKCRNLTTEAVEGKFLPLIGREKEIASLIAAYSTSDKNNRQVLIGKTGVGKTELVQGLALRIASGNVPDSLKKKKIFMINAALFNDADGFSDPVGDIMRRLKGHEEEVILFIDEFQAAFAGKTALPDLLTTVLDRFHCIAATTTEHFQEIKHEMVMARFKEMVIDPLSDPQVKNALRQLAKFSDHEMLIDEEAYDVILEKSNNEVKGRAQPVRAQALFERTVAKAAQQMESTFIPLELANQKAEYQSLREEWKANPQNLADTATLDKLEEMRLTIAGGEQQLNQRKTDVAHYKETRRHYRQHLDNIDRRIQQAVRYKQENKESYYNQEIKQIIFETHYFLPHLDQSVRTQEKNLRDKYSIIPRITKEYAQEFEEGDKYAL